MNTAMQQRSPQEARFDTVREMAGRYKNLMAKVLPQHLSADRMLRVFLAAIQRDSKLLNCSASSLVACLVRAAELGLEPNTGLGLSYLVPFKGVCTLVPGYRGLVQLAVQSGAVTQIRARAVYAGDKFGFEYGLDESLVHVPQGVIDDKGLAKLAHVYSVAKLTNGEKDFDVMTVAEVDRIRKRSKASDNGPWVTDYDEMAKKTVVRRHSKALPASTDPRNQADRQRYEAALEIDQRDAMGRHHAAALVATGEASAELLLTLEQSGEVVAEPDDGGQTQEASPVAESAPNVPASRPPLPGQEKPANEAAPQGPQVLTYGDQAPVTAATKPARKSVAEQREEHRREAAEIEASVRAFDDLGELEAWNNAWRESPRRKALAPALVQQIEKAITERAKELREVGAQAEPGADG
jgi:recombination protein RecT